MRFKIKEDERLCFYFRARKYQRKGKFLLDGSVRGMVSLSDLIGSNLYVLRQRNLDTTVLLFILSVVYLTTLSVNQHIASNDKTVKQYFFPMTLQPILGLCPPLYRGFLITYN
jgi:hypothetical protein